MKSISTLSLLFIFGLFVVSCSNDSEMNIISSDDTALINKIELASKEIVDVSNLPVSAKMVIDQDFADSYVESIQFAKGLGFKISLNTNDESITESKSVLFFSSKGKKLDDINVEEMQKDKDVFSLCFL